ncbi:tail fiber assembly protein, partial [Gilliamella sp. wkB72]|uniref:tail fiber assembly protein n=1 Tax=Gilliamella sp. wkB72 TaxID=3120265 RepID=UPI00114699A3
MTHFYDKKTQSFYIDEINIDIPADSIEITATQHDELHNAINAGCIIFDDLTYSEPPPSCFHKWNGKKWILDKNAENDFKIKQNVAFRDKLINDANEKIAILQDIIDLDMCESNEDEQLKKWKKYRI